jgi:hypothetical protein
MKENPMNHDNAVADDRLNDAERFALELRWYQGHMLPYAEWLTAFVERHRDEILRATNGSGEPTALLVATKRLIAQCGSIHLAGELQAQKREIENELWFRGEKGEYNRAGIQLEWAARHAPAWRRWRIQEYLFVADRYSSQVVALLRATPADRTGSASG